MWQAISKALAIVLILGPAALAGAEDLSRNDMRSLDGQVQEIKSDVLGIAAELSNLEERLLYPSNTEVSVFIAIAKDEREQHRLRKLAKTKTGRELFRQRVPIEHSLAHFGQRQGRRARYRGTRKNEFDMRRGGAIQNLEAAQRKAA